MMTDHERDARRTAHEFFEELAVGHALSALEPGDEQLFLAHLQACAACERAVDEHRETMAHLAYAVDDVDPPAALLAGIERAIAPSGPASSFDSTPSRGSVPISLSAARARRRPRPGLRRVGNLVAVAAAAVAVLALGVSTVQLRQARDDGRHLSRAVQALEQPGSRIVPLARTGQSGAVQAVAVVRGSDVALVLDGLATNDRASTYVLWQVQGESVRPVGTFDVRRNAVDLVRGLRLPGMAAAGQTLAVTREPGRRAPVLPTTSILVSGQIT